MTTHNDWDSNLIVPLVVASFGDTKIYADPTWGIKIRQVMADGRVVPAEPHKALFDDVNFSKIDIGQASFVYRVRFLDFFFAKTFTESSWELEKYTLPRAAKLIRIEYQLRESNERLGPALILESRLVG
jgi:hypothetical protein